MPLGRLGCSCWTTQPSSFRLGSILARLGNFAVRYDQSSNWLQAQAIWDQDKSSAVQSGCQDILSSVFWTRSASLLSMTVIFSDSQVHFTGKRRHVLYLLHLICYTLRPGHQVPGYKRDWRINFSALVSIPLFTLNSSQYGSRERREQGPT